MNKKFISLNVVFSLVVALLSSGLALADKPAQAAATTAPFLWKIDGEKPSYLFGTIHLPDPRVTKLHPAVKQAIDGTDRLYTELPLDPESQATMAQAFIMTGDTTVKGTLSEETYAKLELYLGKRGLPMAALDKMKIWGLTQMVALADYIAQMQQNPPLDAMLYQMASSAGKAVGGLETLEEQLDVFDSLTIEEQVTMLEETLVELDRLQAEGRRLTDPILDAYMSGKLSEIDKAMKESPGSDTELGKKFMAKLLDERNVRMADRIAAKLKERKGESQFFAIGTAHYIGDTSLVTLLTKKGFTVTRVTEAAPAAVEAPAAAAAGGE